MVSPIRVAAGRRTPEQREAHRLQERERRAADPQRNRDAVARHRAKNPKLRGGTTGVVIRNTTEVAADHERGEKECRGCRTVQPFDQFPRNKGFKDGLNSRCKTCVIKRVNKRRERLIAEDPIAWHRARQAAQIKYRYGLTMEEYEALGEFCHICRQIPEKKCIDHDHATGEVRGMLCDPCNTGLGRFYDDPALLEAAAAYLRGVSSE